MNDARNATDGYHPDVYGEPAGTAKAWFSFRGRVSKNGFRRTVWIPAALFVVTQLGIPAVALPTLISGIEPLTLDWFVWGLSMSVLCSLQVRRWHDLGKSGLYAWLALIPCLGWWTWVELWSLPGVVGPNAFGPDPLPSGADLKGPAEPTPSRDIGRDIAFAVCGPCLGLLCLPIVFSKLPAPQHDQLVDAYAKAIWSMPVLSLGAIRLARRGYEQLAAKGFAALSLFAARDFFICLTALLFAA